MLLQNYYNPELLGDASDSCSAVLNVRNQEFLSQPGINGYYCNSASRSKINRFFAVYSQHTMAMESLTVPCFSKDCWLSAGGEQFDCSDSNLSFFQLPAYSENRFSFFGPVKKYSVTTIGATGSLSYFTLTQAARAILIMKIFSVILCLTPLL